MGKVIKIVIGLFVVAVITLIVVLSTLDLNQYKTELTDAVEQATGRELQIGSDLQLGLSLIPTLVVEDVTFSNAGWGSKPEMVILNRFEIEVALLPLLSGNIQVNRLILLEPDILLETNKKGLANWIFASKETEKDTSKTSKSEASLPAIIINKMFIKNANIHYKNGVSGQETKLSIETIELKSMGESEPLSLMMKAAYNEIPVEIKGTIGNIKKLIKNDNYPLDLKIRVSDANIGLKGSVAQPMQGKGLDLDLAFNTDSLSKLSKLAGSDLPPLGPVSLTGKVTESKGTYSITALKLLLGKTDLSGDVTVNISGKRPAITANLNSSMINLVDFAGEDKAKAKGRKDSLFSSKPLPLSGLKSINANVTINAKKIKTSSLVLEKTKIVATLKDGNLLLKPLSTLVSGGSLNGSINLNAGGKIASLITNLTLKGLEPSQFENLNNKISGIKTDVSINVKGNGNSVSQIMAGLNGKLLIKSGGGAIKGSAISIANTSILTMLNPLAKSDTETQLECLAIKFDIKGGIATTDKGIAAVTREMSVIGSGTIDLRTEKINIRIKPHAREGLGLNAGQLAGMLKLEGTLTAPSPTIDARSTLVSVGAAVATGGLSFLAKGLLDSATADANPCISALGQKSMTTSKKEEMPSATTKIVDTVEETGSAVADKIKGLFR
ncbi:MAG: AsmA family protein [Methylophaga sp.]|nr:AsmA family protein [Methylophaga sp.]